MAATAGFLPEDVTASEKMRVMTVLQDAVQAVKLLEKIPAKPSKSLILPIKASPASAPWASMIEQIWVAEVACRKAGEPCEHDLRVAAADRAAAKFVTTPSGASVAEDSLRGIRAGQNTGMQEFADSVSDLGVCMQRSLAKTKVQQDAMSVALEQKQAFVSRAHKQAALIQQELRRQRSERKQSNLSLATQSRKLIDDANEKSEELAADRAARAADTTLADLTAAHQARMEQLQAQRADLLRRTEQALLAQRDAEAATRLKQTRLTTELTTVLTGMDAAMESKDALLRRVQGMREDMRARSARMREAMALLEDRDIKDFNDLHAWYKEKDQEARMAKLRNFCVATRLWTTYDEKVLKPRKREEQMKKIKKKK